jgi:serine/threonine protein kinase
MQKLLPFSHASKYKITE